ncbi:hypothetical protein [Streptomyces sp. NPDC001348]
MVVVVVAIVAGLVRWGIFGDFWPPDDREAAVPTTRVHVGVDLGDATGKVATLALGSSESDLRRGPSGVAGEVDAVDGAPGIVMAYDRARKFLGASPVWSWPGVLETGKVKVSCASTAFSRLLMAPGVATSDPAQVAVLYQLAQSPAVKGSLRAAGVEVCRSIQSRSSGVPRRGEAAAMLAFTRALEAQTTAVAKTLPSAAESVAAIRAATGTSGGPSKALVGLPRVAVAGKAVSAGLLSASAAEAASAETGKSCEDGEAQVAEARGSNPSVVWCRQGTGAASSAGAGHAVGEGGSDVRAVNQGGAWLLAYAADGGSSVPDRPLVAVPPQTAEFPGMEKITTAVLADVVTAVKRGGCAVASLAGLCHVGKMPKSKVVEVTKVVEDGEAEADLRGDAKRALYGIARGNGRGDMSSFPAQERTAGVGSALSLSTFYTVISQLVGPVVSLAADMRFEVRPSEREDEAKALLKAWTSETNLMSRLNTSQGFVESVKLVGEVLKDLMLKPDHLAKLVVWLYPGLMKNVKKAVEKTVNRVVAELSAPAAGWVVLAYDTLDKGESLLTALASVHQFISSGDLPSYSSWESASGGYQDLLDVPPLAPDAHGKFTPAGGQAPGQLADRDGNFRCRASLRLETAGIPTEANCIWVVAPDLDGDGRQDRIAVWGHRASSGYVTSRGLIAQIASTGRYEHLTSAEETVGFNPDPGASPADREQASMPLPLWLADFQGNGRQGLFLRTLEGANTDWGPILLYGPKPGHDGDTLTVAHRPDGKPAPLASGGGYGMGGSFGCVTLPQGGRGIADAGYEAAGLLAPDQRQWTDTVYRWDGTTLKPYAQFGDQTPDDVRPAWMENCDEAPRVRTYPQAKSPESAVRELVKAAAAHSRTRGRFYALPAGFTTEYGTPFAYDDLVSGESAQWLVSWGASLNDYLDAPVVCRAAKNGGAQERRCTMGAGAGKPVIEFEVARGETQYWAGQGATWWFVTESLVPESPGID